jgi:hypothetical protein
MAVDIKGNVSDVRSQSFLIGPTSNDPVSIGLKQSIGANEAFRHEPVVAARCEAARSAGRPAGAPR